MGVSWTDGKALRDRDRLVLINEWMRVSCAETVSRQGELH